MITKEEREKDRAIREAARGGVWSWERHGDGWALYVDRGEPITDELPRGHFCNRQHGLNILTVGPSGFDSHGEPLRAFIEMAGNRMALYIDAFDKIDERMATIEELTRGDDTPESRAATMVLRILRGET